MNVATIASSGMLGAADRLAASASNVANAQSDGPPAYQPLQVDQVSLAGGGTSVSISNTTRYDPSGSYADAGGTVSSPDIDPAAETAQQITALAQFRLSAKSFTTNDAMTQSLLDMKT